jgi:hypothetical protein
MRDAMDDNNITEAAEVDRSSESHRALMSWKQRQCKQMGDRLDQKVSAKKGPAMGSACIHTIPYEKQDGADESGGPIAQKKASIDRIRLIVDAVAVSVGDKRQVSSKGHRNQTGSSPPLPPASSISFNVKREYGGVDDDYGRGQRGEEEESQGYRVKPQRIRKREIEGSGNVAMDKPSDGNACDVMGLLFGMDFSQTGQTEKGHKEEEGGGVDDEKTKIELDDSNSQRKRRRPSIPIAHISTQPRAATKHEPPVTKRHKPSSTDDGKRFGSEDGRAHTSQHDCGDAAVDVLRTSSSHLTSAMAPPPPPPPCGAVIASDNGNMQLMERRQQQLAVCNRVDAARRDEITIKTLSDHFDALLRIPGKVLIDHTNSDILSDMHGMSEVSKMLWTTIVKPRVDKEGVASTLGTLGSLHFCIIGRWGSGKRTAVRSVCAMAGVEVWTIDPCRYETGDLGCAVHVACLRRPCVILIDDFETLHRMKEFVYEVSHQIDACPLLKTAWDGVWIGILLWDDEELERLPWISDLCGPRIARVKPLTGREGATLLTERFLLERNVEISPCLTSAQFDVLADAADGCTPGELKDFASTIMYRMLERTEITPDGVTETTPAPSEVRKYGCAARSKEVEKVKKWRLSWDDDVVPLYQRVNASETEDGIERFYIPKKKKRQVMVIQ